MLTRLPLEVGENIIGVELMLLRLDGYFGIVDHHNHKCYLEFVNDHDHDTIIPIIQRHVMAGVRIHSDGAQVCCCLR